MIRVSKPPKRAGAHFNALFYGLTNAGKTTLLGTANECEATSPILIVNIDGGILSLADKDIDITSPTSFPELQEVYDELRSGSTKYRSVGIDSLTEEQRTISMGTLMGDVDEDLAFTDLGKASAPTRQEYLKSAMQMRKLIRGFRDLSYLKNRKHRLHVFMTAGEKQDDARGRSLVCPSLPGVLALEAGGYVDVLGRLTIKKRRVGDKIREVRYLQTSLFTDDSEVTYLAKNRLGRLGKGVWDPTISRLIELWTAQ